MPNDPEQNADHMFECAERQEEKAHSEASKAYQCAMCSDKVLDKGKRFGILSTKLFLWASHFTLSLKERDDLIVFLFHYFSSSSDTFSGLHACFLFAVH